MSDFKPFSTAVAARFQELSQHELYVVDADGIFDTYLNAYPQGYNPIFRERTVHDCSCCKNFVRSVGHVVAIIDGKIETVWDVDVPHPYDVVAATMAEHVRSLQINGVFRTKERQYGAETSRELRDGETHTWDHFVAKIASRHHASDPAAIRGRFNSVRKVFKRGLEELKLTAFEDVLDLIGSKSLYRGEEHNAAVGTFKALKQTYDATPEKDRELFTWRYADSPAARFRNTVMGTLIQDLSEGVPLERAVKSFEAKVAPANYKRPSALITPRMIDSAVKTLKDLNLESAVERRFARIGDVTVNNVLWVNGAVQQDMRGGLAGMLMEEVKHSPTCIADATPISMEEFMSSVVPDAKDLKILVKNSHVGNFMSLTAPANEDSGALFKWGNDFAWSYDGDVADSIKQRVKAAGGNVEADLRISLAWFNFDDLDIHCRAPGSSREIYYGDKQGVLDVDMNVSANSRQAVENLSFMNPRDGTYEVTVRNYSRRESIDTGFVLEVECDGIVQTFSSAASPRSRATFNCLRVRVKNGSVVGVDMGCNELEAGASSQDKWGVTTESLVTVNTLMASPNHWDDNDVGNKHWFFILEGCLNPGTTRGIYNEFLASKLEEHRKVFEVLGAKTKCPQSDTQLSGLGFSSTRSDSVVLVVSNGSKSRAYDVKM